MVVLYHYIWIEYASWVLTRIYSKDDLEIETGLICPG